MRVEAEPGGMALAIRCAWRQNAEESQNPCKGMDHLQSEGRSLTDIREKRGWVRDDSRSSCGVRAQP